METLNELVKSKKSKIFSCSNLFPYQLLKDNTIAREMFQLLEEEKMVMTPYSPLAAGRVCRLPTDEVTKRSSNDPINVKKYEHAKEIDLPVIKRINEMADKINATMAQVALAWMFTKPLVASPIVGFTKISQLESICDVFKIKLSDDDIKYLEELYLPHKVVGALQKNK